MCPYPSQIDLDAIVSTATTLIEAEGAEQLSLHRLAAALGVKAPSLYRYVPNKLALLRAVNERTSAALVDAMRAAGESAEGAPGARIVSMAQTYRAFAQAHPAAYSLAFAPQDPAARPDPALLAQMVLPLQDLVAGVSGEAEFAGRATRTVGGAARLRPAGAGGPDAARRRPGRDLHPGGRSLRARLGGVASAI